MSKRTELEAKLESVRERLAEVVGEKELDLEAGYELLHEIQRLTIDISKEAEVADALEVLRRNGVMFKVWDEEDVRRRVVQLGVHLHNVPKIVQHVVEGDDWETMAEELAEEDANIWAMIKGTAGDHPEWFTGQALEKL